MKSMLALALVLTAPILALPAAAPAAAACRPDAEDAAAIDATRNAVERACDCAAASSHGAYLVCAHRVVGDAVAAGSLRGGCGGAVMRFAARSTCGLRDVDVCCVKPRAGRWHAVRRAAARGCFAPPGGSSCVADARHLADACDPDGGCIANRCGNGVLDPGEECDDGNAIDGDGCSAQCLVDCPCFTAAAIDAAFPPGFFAPYGGAVCSDQDGQISLTAGSCTLHGPLGQSYDLPIVGAGAVSSVCLFEKTPLGEQGGECAVPTLTNVDAAELAQCAAALRSSLAWQRECGATP